MLHLNWETRSEVYFLSSFFFIHFLCGDEIYLINYWKLDRDVRQIGFRKAKASRVIICYKNLSLSSFSAINNLQCRQVYLSGIIRRWHVAIIVCASHFIYVQYTIRARGLSVGQNTYMVMCTLYAHIRPRGRSTCVSLCEGWIFFFIDPVHPFTDYWSPSAVIGMSVMISSMAVATTPFGSRV